MSKLDEMYGAGKVDAEQLKIIVETPRNFMPLTVRLARDLVDARAAITWITGTNDVASVIAGATAARAAVQDDSRALHVGTPLETDHGGDEEG